MNYTYFGLLLKLKNKGSKEDEDFVNYLMYKYIGEEPLFDEINKWSEYFIKEDIEHLDNIIYEMEKIDGQPSSD